MFLSCRPCLQFTVSNILVNIIKIHITYGPPVFNVSGRALITFFRQDILLDDPSQKGKGLLQSLCELPLKPSSASRAVFWKGRDLRAHMGSDFLKDGVRCRGFDIRVNKAVEAPALAGMRPNEKVLEGWVVVGRRIERLEAKQALLKAL
jgi:hypothetical protein